MKTVGADEAKTDLARLLAEVAQGETITITEHGEPVAELVPPTGRRPSADEAIDRLHEFRRRKNLSLGGITIRELIDEGRRWP